MKDQQKYITSIVILVTSIYIVGELIEKVLGIGISSLITISSVSFMIYSLFVLWNKWIWKVRWINYLLCKLAGFYEYPVLEGKWKANYESSYKNGVSGKGDISIQQDYSSLFIEGNFGRNSSFYSFFAQLSQKKNGKWFLVYAYRNKPQNPLFLNSVSGGMHEGFTYLDVINKSKLAGYYSNDENRKTRGKLVLTRAD